MYLYLFFAGAFFFFTTLEAGAFAGTFAIVRILVVGASVVVVVIAFAGTFAIVRILVVGASIVVVVAVVVVVVVAVCFTALPDIGKLCNAMIKITANRNNDDECILVCRETTMRT
jgi:hypothetical protein